MSIRTVTCPACQATANVMPSMTNIKCPSCGVVWDINNPPSARPAKPIAAESEDSEPSMMVVGATASVAVLVIAVLGIMAVWLTSGSDDKPTKAAETAVAAEASDQPPSYREVDLPESTRQKIYRDYRRMAATTIEKKVPVPKDSPVRKRVEGVLKQLADRDVEMTALNYNVSADDIMQIVAEGDAKKWPGSKQPDDKQP